MSARKAITILVILIALILTGTVVVLTTVVQYFGVDSRDIITEPEMRLYERLAAQSPPSTLPATPGQKVVGGGVDGDRPLEGAKAEEGVVEVVVGQGGESHDGQSVKELLNRLDERGWFGNSSTTAAPVEALAAAKEGGATPQPRIPKIIHATWKTDTLPVRWEKVRQGCIDMHPDYEFKLWSDAASRAFIAEHYPWFLSTFDGYTYPIQRADVIRYFVLHHYGGVYMDLDIGCRRNLDPLLYFQVILPATIPVGVSNDLMFAEKGHPFMDLVIHNLITFDHTYGTNYPTVMFSTGPMFLSAQYGLWPKDVAEGEERQVRVLPRRWYGKNAPPSQMEDSYFDHFYGSSWHAEDAGFITFLGKFGMALMYAGLLIVVLGVVRLIWSKRPIFKGATPRSIGPIALPYEALPFTRPGTPGSRPASPANGRGGPPASGGRNGNGGLFFLPVWLMPTGEGTSPGGSQRTPNGETGGNWSQYFSNLSFVADEHGHRYEPVPNFSRPPSPSNNSILHAPGSTHDGAFDGTPLHSIHAPRAVRPTSAARSSIDSDRSSSTATTTTPLHRTQTPSSPNPPAYSALRSWGTSLFRASPFSTSPRAPLLPLSHPNSHNSAETSPQPSPQPFSSKPLPASSSSAHQLPSPAATTGRPVSPAPPAYASLGAGTAGPGSSSSSSSSAGRSPSPSFADARSRSPRTGSPPSLSSSSSLGGASAPSTTTKTGDRTELQTPGTGTGTGAGTGELDLDDHDDRDHDPVGVARSGASSRASSHGRRVSGGMGIGGRVEEEVDRLLSEMAPEDYAKAE